MSEFASANRQKIVYIKESAWGTTPATPALKELRITGGDMGENINTAESNEIRSDRMTSDLVNVSSEASGEVPFEFSATAFDDILEGVLCGSWTTDVLKNGVLEPSYTIQRQFLDLTAPKYENFVGSRLGNFSLSVSAGEIVTGSFGFQAKGGDVTATQFTSATIVAAPTDSILSAVAGVTAIEIDGTESTNDFTSISLTIENNLRRQQKIKSLSSAGIAYGRFSAKGSITIYFEDIDFYTKFKAGTSFSFGFILEDADGNSREILLPKCKVSSHKIIASGLDTDVMAEIEFTALAEDVTHDAMIVITRVDAE